MADTPIYKYYTPVYSEEHMLSAREIAVEYGISTVNNKPHSRLVKLLIANSLSDFDHRLKLPLYYNTKKGLMRVYSKLLYDPILKEFQRKSSLIESTEKTIAMVDDTKTINFKYKIIELKER